jgi:hypothetical protein
MAGFVYNPAESIKQNFQQVGSTMGNIFAQVIQQQQRDYNLAENTFANIEALKKDLNIYGQKSITSKANALLGNASSAILSNGKLDYSKIGEIRQAVSDIKDLKTGYDLGAKEYERMLQIGVANKDNLTSFEGFYKDLSAKMSDENLVKNPRDLQAALADTYTKSLDATKMFGKTYLAANPYQPYFKEIIDGKGNLIRVQGELPVGWTSDANGNPIPPAPVTVKNPDGTTTTVDYADQALAQLKANNPDALVAMRRQAGFPGQNISEKQLVEYYINKIPKVAKPQQIASADELKAKELAVNKAQFDVNTQGEEWAMKKKLMNAQIANYYEQRGSSGAGGFTPQNLGDLGITVNPNGKIASFGGDGIKIDVPTGTRRKPGATVPFKAVRTRTLANGKRQIGGYYLDAENKPRNPQLVYVDYDEGSNQIQSGLTSAINKMPKEDRLFYQTQLLNFDRAEIPQKQTSSTPSMSNSDILSYKPTNWKATDAEFISAFKTKNNIK